MILLFHHIYKMDKTRFTRDCIACCPVYSFEGVYLEIKVGTTSALGAFLFRHQVVGFSKLFEFDI